MGKPFGSECCPELASLPTGANARGQKVRAKALDISAAAYVFRHTHVSKNTVLTE
jgi:hypothetical protein